MFGMSISGLCFGEEEVKLPVSVEKAPEKVEEKPAVTEEKKPEVVEEKEKQPDGKARSEEHTSELQSRP